MTLTMYVACDHSIYTVSINILRIQLRKECMKFNINIFYKSNEECIY